MAKFLLSMQLSLLISVTLDKKMIRILVHFNEFILKQITPRERSKILW